MSSDIIGITDGNNSPKGNHFSHLNKHINELLFVADDSPPTSDTSRFNGHSSFSSNCSGQVSSNQASCSTSIGGTRINLLISSSSSNSSVPASPKHNTNSHNCKFYNVIKLFV